MWVDQTFKLGEITNYVGRPNIYIGFQCVGEFATTSVSHPFGRPGNLRVLDWKGIFSAVLRRNYVELC